MYYSYTENLYVGVGLNKGYSDIEMGFIVKLDQASALHLNPS